MGAMQGRHNSPRFIGTYLQDLTHLSWMGFEFSAIVSLL